jgi:hypothetical protein
MAKTLHDWEIYIQALAGPTLRSKAIAANTQRFVNALKADGMSMSGVYQVISRFVIQMQITGMAIPSGGIYDMPGMAEIDTTERKVLDPETRAVMIANPPPEEDLENVWFDDLSRI